MSLKKEAFVAYTLPAEKEEIIISVRVSPEEIELFKKAKEFIQQPKTSTALKQLATIGAIVVLHDQKVNEIFDIIINNKRKNIRLGVTEKEITEFKK